MKDGWNAAALICPTRIGAGATSDTYWGWGFSDLAHFARGFKQVNTVHDVASGKATLDAIPRDELVIVPRSKRTNSNRRRDFPL